MNWFKLYTEFASDPKVQSMSEAMQRRLVMLYCLKCQGDLAKLDDEEIALFLRITPAELEKTRDLFRRKGFINDGWSIPKWELRQKPADPTAAERMRRMRANKVELVTDVARNGAVTDVVTMSGVTRTVLAGARPGVEGEEIRTEGEGESPPPPLSPIPDLGPEYTALGEWAITLGDEVSWGRWVLQQGRCGHSVKDIRAALEECAGAGKLSQAYAAAKLRGWAADGGRPKRKGEDNGKTAVHARPEDTIARLEVPDLDRLPDTPETAWIRQHWAEQRKAAAR